MIVVIGTNPRLCPVAKVSAREMLGNHLQGNELMMQDRLRRYEHVAREGQRIPGAKAETVQKTLRLGNGKVR